MVDFMQERIESRETSKVMEMKMTRQSWLQVPNKKQTISASDAQQEASPKKINHNRPCM